MMRLPTLNPKQLRELVDDGVCTAQRARSLVPRMGAVLDVGGGLLGRITALLSRIEQAEAQARLVIDRVDATQELARSVVERANASTLRLTALVDLYEPALLALRPAVTRLSETVGPAQVDALATVISRGPRLSEQFTDDVLPVIETLRSVAPDLTDLLGVSRALNEILGSVPGLGRAKKRVDEELEHVDQPDDT